MQRISNINFTFVSNDSFVAECSVRELGINAFDIYEFVKQPWNSIYEEHILCGKFNYIGRLVNKNTHIYVDGEVVELNGIYYRVIDINNSEFSSEGIIRVTFKCIDNYDKSEYYFEYSQKLYNFVYIQEYEKSEKKDSDALNRQMKEFSRNCVIFKVEVYDEQSDDIKVFGYNYYELELARKVASEFDIVNVYLFENVTPWEKDDFIAPGKLERYLKLYHGFIV